MTPVPGPVARIADTMSTFCSKWALCGGWAVDAWLGRQTREHADVDIAVFHDDMQMLFEHLAGWQMIAHDTPDADHSDPWDGRPLNAPAHIHARAPDAFNLEFLLNERSRHNWILNRTPQIIIPLRRSVRQSGWHMPTLAPEVLLFYKATAYDDLRPQDELDLLALLPHLTGEQRHWLWEVVSIVEPGHPWLARHSH